MRHVFPDDPSAKEVRMPITVRDMETRDEPEFCRCLESWSEEMKESGDHKARWIEKMKSEGLGVKIAVDDDGGYAGMIQYYPSRFAPLEEPEDGLWFIHCTWVHGYKKGQGNYQKRGIGKSLLAAAEEDVRARGGRAVAAWGITLPFWMRSAWYKKHGYLPTDKDGGRELVVKSLDGENHSASWLKPGKTPPSRLDDGRTALTAFVSGACPSAGIACERLREAAAEAALPVEVIDSSDPANLTEWGRSDVLFIGSRKVEIGPPPSKAKLGRILSREARKAGRYDRKSAAPRT